MRRALFILMLVAPVLLPIARPAFAEGPGQPPPSAAELVRFDARGPLEIAPGGTARARLKFRVRDSWHVNAHRPNEDFLVPTVLSFSPAGGLTAGTPVYPKAKQAKLSFSDTPLAVYEEEFEIEVPVTAAATAAPGAHELVGALRFQSCNDQVCLPPASIPVRIAMRVEGTAAISAPPPTASAPGTLAGAPGAASGAAPGAAPGAASDTATLAPLTAAPAVGSPPGGGTGGGAAPGTDLVARWFSERGTLFAFLLIFLMGLALNLTPCVYPMMGVTISLFGGGVGGGGLGAPPAGGMKALPRALVYVLGIAIMYSTLGVIAALTGGLFGGWLANPWVLGAIGLLLLAMALSMFGLYELSAPSGLLTKIGGAAGASLFGTFLAGLLVGVFAAPCIGPPIIALLAFVGAKGDPWFGFWAFFVLSIGLGLPYLVLGVSTGLITRLPRSGSWMEWVKHLFGVVLLGVAAFYLCLAIAPSKLAWVVPGALGLGGLYLGFFEPTGRDRAGFRRFKWAVGVAGLVAAALVWFRAPAPAVTWEPYSDAAVAQARIEGRPVVLDFGADWCVPCHELDNNTFTDRGVAEALAPFTRLKVDFTRDDAPEVITLRARYAITGVPTVLFLGPDGHEIAAARIVGYLPPAPFLEHVRVARTASSLTGGS
ncbi:MAG: cytochrome c biogenesis protein CcdA [Candidatus Eisenbacteria bacterium]